MDVDEVIERIGGFGRAQKKIVWLLSLAHFAVAFHTLSISFIGVDPGWSCEELVKAQTCVLKNCTPQFSQDFTSIVTEWGLICSKSKLPKLSQSAFFVGLLLGAWIFGWLADSIGRRKAFFISAVLMGVSGFGYGLAPSFYIFVSLRVCAAISSTGLLLSSYVLSVEIVGASSRSFAGLLGSALFALGYPLLSFMAYFIRRWRVLVCVYSAVVFSALLLFRIIPESPRWLVVNGRLAEGRSVLAAMAKANGTVMPEGELKRPSKHGDESLGMTSLLRGPVIRKGTLTLLAIWFTVCMVYYALAMRSGDLGSNRYVSFSLSGLVEIPSIFLGFKLLNILGRKWTHGCLLLCSGVACLLWSALYWTGNSSLGALVAMVGKFAVAGAFAVIYLYTTELFPTEVRNIGLGVSTVGARLGGIFAPIVLMADEVDHGLPMLVMGGLVVCVGLLSLKLPETLDKPMPETLQELESNYH